MPPITYYVDVSVLLEGAAVAVTPMGVPMFLTTHTRTVNRADVYSSLSEMADDGFISSDEAYKWATALLSQAIVPDSFIIGRIDAGDANITESINAVQAANDSFYFVNIESRADADIKDVALWTEAQKKVFVAQSSDADILTATTPNIASELVALGYNRTNLWYHALDAEYMDAAITGRCGSADLDAQGGVLTWANKSLAGVTVNSLATAALTNIRDGGANVYHVVTSANNVTTPGKMVSGRFIDVQTSLDWYYFRTQEAAFAALVAPSTKVPFTQAGIDVFEGTVRDVLERGKVNGHGSPDVDAVTTAPKIGEISAADKTARILRTITGEDTLAGAIHQVVIRLNVTQ